MAEICNECNGRGEILNAPNNVLDGHPYWELCPKCEGRKKIMTQEEKDKEDDEDRLLINKQRYLDAAHAVQTGVAYELKRDPTGGTPKHLRVGVNMEMVHHAGLVQLLINKGVLTENEYVLYMAEATEEEVRRYEALLLKKYHVKVTLR